MVRRRGHSEAAAGSRSSGAAEPETAELRARPELEPKRAGAAAGLVLPPLAGGGTSAGAAGAGGGGGYGGGRPSKPEQRSSRAEPETAELRVQPPELEPKRAGAAAGLVLPPLAGGGRARARAGGGGGYGGGRPSLSRASPLSLSLSPCSLRAPIPPIHSLRLGCFLAAHRSCGCPPVGTAAAAGAAAAALRARQRRRRRRLRRLRLPLVC